MIFQPALPCTVALSSAALAVRNTLKQAIAVIINPVSSIVRIVRFLHFFITIIPPNK